jgi:hypothetical protein
LHRQLASLTYRVVSLSKKTSCIVEAKAENDRADPRAIAEPVRLDASPLAYMPYEKIAARC